MRIKSHEIDNNDVMFGIVVVVTTVMFLIVEIYFI